MSSPSKCSRIPYRVTRPTRRTTIMKDLLPLAETIAARLKARKETIAIAESSTGGLISAALLAMPGASAYFLGGGGVFTPAAEEPLPSGRAHTIPPILAA